MLAGICRYYGYISHGLYGSTSCCISQWPKQWGRAIFDHPQRQNHWTDFNKTWYIPLHLEATRPANFHFDTATWVVWANSQFATVCFSFLFFFVFFAKSTGRTVRPIWTNEGSERVVPRKEVHFEGLNDVPLNFRDKSPQSWNCGGMNRTYKPERQKIQILITWNYLADQGIRTMNEPLWVVPWLPNKFKMAAAAIFNFWKMSITPDWIKISAPNLMWRCVTAMRRCLCDQKSKPEINSRDVIKWTSEA